MRLTEIIQILQDAFEQVGYIYSISFGDVYDHWNNNKVQYVAACTDLENVQSVGDLKKYSFVIYVADKLLDDNSNTTHALDYSEAAIDATLNYIDQHPDIIEVESNRTYTPFVQRFADTLAGYWLRVAISVEPDIVQCDC